MSERLTDEFISRCIVQYREWKERRDSWANETMLSALIELQERRAEDALVLTTEERHALVRHLAGVDWADPLMVSARAKLGGRGGL